MWLTLTSLLRIQSQPQNFGNKACVLLLLLFTAMGCFVGSKVLFYVLSPFSIWFGCYVVVILGKGYLRVDNTTVYKRVFSIK